MNLLCPICENKIEIPKSAKIGGRLSCEVCFTQLSLQKVDGEFRLGCAICKEPIFDADNCEECERRHQGKKIIEEGRL